jgi:hypothetical protein
MSSVEARPRKGLPPDQALERWSDKAAYAELVKLSGRSPPPSVEDCSRVIRDINREREYVRKRDAVEHAFRELLQEGTVLGSGIDKWGGGREVIHPSLWELLEIDYGCFGDAVGDGRQYEKVEFFDRMAIPLNVVIPDWLAAELAPADVSVFRPDRTYQHVWFDGIEFRFGPVQAKVVEFLHKAVLAGDPWQHGPRVLEQAGSKQIKLGDVFKSQEGWRRLIKSDHRGMYRLGIDETGKRIK